MDRQREELSLPGYMQVKGVKKASSASRAAKRSPAGQTAPRKISLEEFASSAGQGGGAKKATRQRNPQAPKTRPSAGRSSRPVPAAAKTAATPKAGAATTTRQRAQGSLGTSPAPAKTGAKKSASSQRAAPAKKRAAQAANLDMTSSRIANQPRRAEGMGQAKRGARIKAGRLALVLLLAAGLCGGIYALAKALPSQGQTAQALEVGATAKLPQGVSVLGVDLSGQSKSAARGAVSAAADAVLSEAKVTIKLGEHTYTISGSEVSLSYDVEAVLARALAYTPPEKGETGVVDVTNRDAPGEFNDIFTYDQAALARAVAAIAAKFDIEPVDAVGEPTMNADHTVTFQYQNGQNGRALDVEATVEKIESMFGKGVYSAQIDGVYGEVEPAITAAMLSEEIGVRGSFTTRYATIGKTSKETPVIENRVFNIHKASDIINGCMVAPGEEWSFNTYVGPRTVSGGWKEAMGIAYGKEYIMQAGGGICQVSTTLYNALQQAKVNVTVRQAHSIPSDYVDHGLDATVDYATNLDLKFKNDTGAPLYLFAYYEDVEGRHRQDITFIIYGKPLENGVTYKMRSVTTDEKKRTDVIYTEDETIPRGYKVVTTEARPSYVAEVYLDKYMGNALMDSQYLYTDKYAGNAEYARLGAGSPKYHEVPAGAVAVN